MSSFTPGTEWERGAIFSSGQAGLPRDETSKRSSWNRSALVELEVVDTPADAITMRTPVRIIDLHSGKSLKYSLVHSWEAEVAANEVSVQAAPETALPRSRMPREVRRLKAGEICSALLKLARLFGGKRAIHTCASGASLCFAACQMLLSSAGPEWA